MALEDDNLYSSLPKATAEVPQNRGAYSPKHLHIICIICQPPNKIYDAQGH